MSDREIVTFNGEQFQQIDLGIDGISGALNKLAERIGPANKDESLHKAIADLSENVGKWQSTQNETIRAGFAQVAEAIAKLQPLPTPPQPSPMRGTIMSDYAIPATQPDGRVTFHLTAKDEEGNEITNPAEFAEMSFEVLSNDESVFVVTMDADQPDPINRVGGYHVGGTGQAALTSNLSNNDQLIATGTDGFTVTAGEATIGGVASSFEGLTPIEPPAEG